VGLAVGFGAQSLVQDVIGGFFILLEDQIRVGDVVRVKDKGGLVECIGLRMITLRDFDGSVHYIRNGQIDIVTNMTKGYSNNVFDVQIGYRENVDEVMQILRDIDAELRADPQFKDLILAPIEVLGLDKFAESGVIIRARSKTRPIQQWNVGREFNRRLKRKFDERGIEIPFRHMTLTFAQDKAGRAQKLPVQLEGKTGEPNGKAEGEG
jgi:moderate conductance mechanosensitive channel